MIATRSSTSSTQPWPSRKRTSSSAGGGRLEEYKYYDMDDVIKSALERVKVELKK